MVLTNCAACAAPLAHDAPGCGVCATRYCGEACRLDAQRGGHNEVCLAIHRGGGAEQYHADKKYKEEVAIEKRAREACGDDTKGQMYGHPMTESIVACGLQTALDNFRGAIVALAETERTARRLLGSAHPVTAGIEVELRYARAALAASETPLPRSA